MVNSSSVNVGLRQTTRGEDIRAEGTISLSPGRFSPGPRIVLGRHCGSACLAQEMGQGTGMGPAVCPMVCRRIAERIRECLRQAREVLELKTVVDDAVKESPSVKHVVVFRRTGHVVPMIEGRDHWWHDLMAKASSFIAPVPLESTHLLYILYTSGTTGKPKGVAHGTGGYLVFAYATQEWVFDAKDDDVYWCTADIG